MNTSTPHAFALFSGGLDSILAARLIMEQGLVVRCLHFVTPFFGKPQLIPHWEKVYGLEVEAVDVGEAFVRLLKERPAHGRQSHEPLCRLQNPHDAQGAGTHEKMGSVIPYLR